MESKKVLTYIEGLDETLGGGLPAGHVVLLSGLPGTMKSTLSYSILHWNARERGAKCLYVSLEHRGRVKEVLRNWPEKDVRVICATSGERILGLLESGP